MEKWRERLSLLALVAVYLLFSYHYFPDDPMRSLTQTAWHILRFAPFVVGLTMLIVKLLTVALKAQVPRERVLRLLLTVAIFCEILYGLHHYLNPV